MLGKDYMLAIILVNCDDNLWSDHSLDTDPDLPPSWRKIHDSQGTYYWHVPTGTTQWQHPTRSTSPGGCLKADGEETLQETDCQAPAVKHTSKARPVPSPMASLTRRTSLTWQGDDFQQCGTEPSSKCFAVRSLGWVEIPEEDLAPGKSSIAVNNCIQQLSNSQGSADSRGEGQDLVMILKKDTMSLVDPLDHSLIHRQHILNIRVWGVGCNKGRCRARGGATAAIRDGPGHELTTALFPPPSRRAQGQGLRLRGERQGHLRAQVPRLPLQRARQGHRQGAARDVLPDRGGARGSWQRAFTERRRAGARPRGRVAPACSGRPGGRGEAAPALRGVVHRQPARAAGHGDGRAERRHRAAAGGTRAAQLDARPRLRVRHGRAGAAGAGGAGAEPGGARRGRAGAAPAGGGRGARVAVRGALRHLPRRGPRRAHLRADRRHRAALPVRGVLVRARRGHHLGGGADGLHGSVPEVPRGRRAGAEGEASGRRGGEGGRGRRRRRGGIRSAEARAAGAAGGVPPAARAAAPALTGRRGARPALARPPLANKAPRSAPPPLRSALGSVSPRRRAEGTRRGDVSPWRSST
ncbi:amyloid-beta A4 precursor protein-binding family B member 3 isoform X1 [Excalfactoria chinensis]|uniref:amyloid-beta A4 precursor protein-binding family B member 3 isoform X1 n=1 Tax=Excalfactoria chinensis TaxID=46218 RepID=UPI003B3A173B